MKRTLALLASLSILPGNGTNRFVVLCGFWMAGFGGVIEAGAADQPGQNHRCHCRPLRVFANSGCPRGSVSNWLRVNLLLSSPRVLPLTPVDGCSLERFTGSISKARLM